jgi:hypothetical protein
MECPLDAGTSAGRAATAHAEKDAMGLAGGAPPAGMCLVVGSALNRRNLDGLSLS